MSSLSYLAYTDDTGKIFFPAEPVIPPFPEIASHTKIYPGTIPANLDGTLGTPGVTVTTAPYTTVGGKFNISGDHIDYVTMLAIFNLFLEGENLFLYHATTNYPRYFIGVLEPPKFFPKQGAQRGEEESFGFSMDFIISSE